MTDSGNGIGAPDKNLQISGKTGEARRDERGRFQPGQSGNPAGRPKSIRNRATLLAQAMLAEEAENLVRTMLDRALYRNDPVALRLCIERIMSPRRTEAPEFVLPPLHHIKDAPVALAAISQAVSEGAITPAEAGQLSDVVNRFVYAWESVELAARLETLEEADSRLRQQHGRA